MTEPTLSQDMHVHSTFSDGKSTIAENVAEAEALGLAELTCVDHVRADTDWVPEYVAAVRAIREETTIQVHCAVEAKILNTEGILDLPEELNGVDAVYAADHQVPSSVGPLHPRAVRSGIDAGDFNPDEVLAWIVVATAAAVRRYENVVIAHLFSVLPKIGLSEEQVPLELIDGIAAAAAKNGARIEVDERWECPSARTIQPFLSRGVPLLLSTDSHRRETIGRYEYCAATVEELRRSGPARAG